MLFGDVLQVQEKLSTTEQDIKQESTEKCHIVSCYYEMHIQIENNDAMYLPTFVYLYIEI